MGKGKKLKKQKVLIWRVLLHSYICILLYFNISSCFKDSFKPVNPCEEASITTNTQETTIKYDILIAYPSVKTFLWQNPLFNVSEKNCYLKLALKLWWFPNWKFVRMLFLFMRQKVTTQQINNSPQKLLICHLIYL